MTSIVSKPWGSFQVIEEGENYSVKKIIVKSQAKLSLQSHDYRSEYWVVVEGTAEVTMDKNITIIKQNQGIFIPKRTKHRLTNNYDKDLIIIEVWYGERLEEEDIIRYDDVYNRI